MPDSDSAKATAALIVSICSASFTGIGLILQSILYRLSGARLKVQLVFGYRADHGLTIIYTGRRPPKWEDFTRNRVPTVGIEYAQVRVTNIGRTPVYVENICLDIGFDRWFRRTRRAVTPLQFIDPEAESTNMDPRSAYRLEPGENISVAFQVWPGLADPALFEHRRIRKRVVRGQARAVGRWRVARSPWWRAWRFRKGALSRFRGYVPPPDERVYRVLWKWSSQESVGLTPLEHHSEIVTLLEEGKNDQDIRAFLNTVNPNPSHQVVAWEAHHAFHSLIGHPMWVNDEGEPDPNHP